MVKINLSNFEKLEKTEKEYAEKTINNFVQKISSRTREIDAFHVSLDEKRRRDGNYGVSEFSVKMISKYGVTTSTGSDWDKKKALKEALNKLEKQIRKKV